MKKIYIASFVVVLAIIGAYFFPVAPGASKVSSFGGTSSTGTYNNVTSWSSITLVPSSNSATTTSILNNGASDRAVMGNYVMCTGATSVGLPLTSTGWIITAATTSVSSTGLQGNTNLVMYNSIATTTGVGYMASTTIGVADFGRIWPVNTYLTFAFNASSTASCSLGVEWLPL